MGRVTSHSRLGPSGGVIRPKGLPWLEGEDLTEASTGHPGAGDDINQVTRWSNQAHGLLFQTRNLVE